MSELSEQGGHPVPAPDVGECYSHGLATLKKYFLEILLITLVVWVLQSPYYVAWEVSDHLDSGIVFIIVLFGLGYGLLIAGPVDWGAKYARLKAVRGEKPEFLDIFVFQKNYLNVVLGNLLTSMIILVGFVFLIVPGVIFACKLVFVPYLVTDRNMEATEAIRESWRMTTGHTGTIFLMGLLAIPIFFAGILLLVVGATLSDIWINLSFASIYHSVASRDIPADKV